jgi:hypothetical protein
MTTLLLHLHLLSSFLFVSWGGVRLSPLGTSANIWSIVSAPDDRLWVWSSRWNENWQGKPKYSEKTCPSATLSTTNPIWPDLGSNPATNRLSYGTALIIKYESKIHECNVLHSNTWEYDIYNSCTSALRWSCISRKKLLKLVLIFKNKVTSQMSCFAFETFKPVLRSLQCNDVHIDIFNRLFVVKIKIETYMKVTIPPLLR